MTSDSDLQWSKLGAGYRKLVVAASESSAFLRDIGLKPTVLRLLGDCTAAKVLDIGTGNGWLFETLDVGSAHACDLVRPEHLADGVEFKISDASSLQWPDGEFDVIVSNLVLCYVEDIARPLTEMARVAKLGGRLLVSLVHPYFYRTIIVGADGSITLNADLSKPSSFDISIGGKIGPFRYYYRPYPDYMNAILTAGWRIREVSDWFIDEAQYAASFPDGDTIARSPRVPLFTFFSCDRQIPSSASI